MYVTNRSAILKGDLVRLSVDRNCQIWILDYGSEMVYIHTVREGAAGFSNVKSIISAIDPGARPAPFAIPSNHLPAPVPTSLTP